jgi:hypothetical protein
MRAPSEADLLLLWETGQHRHPIDRALLLCAWARPDIDPECVARLPLGVVNAALMKLRVALFGARLELQAICAHCGETLEIPLAVDELLNGMAAPEDGGEVAAGAYRFRLPASRDLAEIAYELDAEAAVLRLLDTCCVARPAGHSETDVLPVEVLAEADVRLEAADPLADLSLSVTCAACSGNTEVALDIGALLWDDVQAHARALLGQVHALARAYGWTEADILALTPRRRAAYLDLAGF